MDSLRRTQLLAQPEGKATVDEIARKLRRALPGEEVAENEESLLAVTGEASRLVLEQGRRVLCTDRHSWSSERIVQAFRGQWNVEELLRRTRAGRSFLGPFPPVGRRLDTAAHLRHGARADAGQSGPAGAAAEVFGKVHEGGAGRYRGDAGPTTNREEGTAPTELVRPVLDRLQRRAVASFEPARWMPRLSPSRPPGAQSPQREPSS